jgi:AraC family transcriptional regulator
MAEFDSRLLLSTDTVDAWDVVCPGRWREASAEEFSTRTHLVFPYRGIYVHRVGLADHVAEANQVVFINEGEPYRVSHPVDGGDATVSIGVDAATLLELTPSDYRHPRGRPSFNRSGLRIDTRSQALAAELRHRLTRDTIDHLAAETLTLELIRHTLGHNVSHTAQHRNGRSKKIADRAKLILHSDLSRRWTLKDVAALIGISPIYLTDVFCRVEGLPLYRYHLRLRLARALSVLADYDNLTKLALDLGFNSHSHFSAVFKQTYKQTPSEFQRVIRRQRGASLT